MTRPSPSPGGRVRSGKEASLGNSRAGEGAFDSATQPAAAGGGGGRRRGEPGVESQGLLHKRAFPIRGVSAVAQ